MLERLHFVLGGCVGEGTQDSDCISWIGLTWKVAGRGRRSRGGHLCFVDCALLLLLLLFL